MRTSPRCVGIVKRRGYIIRNGRKISRIPGDQCSRSINCPMHKEANGRIMQLPFEQTPTINYTWEDVKKWINEGHFKSTGKLFFTEEEK